MVKSFYAKPLASYLVAALLVLSTFSGTAEAMFLKGQTAPVAVDRSADLGSIQKTLEAKTIRQRLLDYGLSPEDAMARLNNLSDAQVHQLAANMNAVQAGGDMLVDLVFIALLVVLLVYVLEGRIEIRRR